MSRLFDLDEFLEGEFDLDAYLDSSGEWEKVDKVRLFMSNNEVVETPGLLMVVSPGPPGGPRRYGPIAITASTGIKGPATTDHPFKYKARLITHLPSGQRIGGMKTIEQAKCLAEAVLELIPILSNNVDRGTHVRDPNKRILAHLPRDKRQRILDDSNDRHDYLMYYAMGNRAITSKSAMWKKVAEERDFLSGAIKEEYSSGLYEKIVSAAEECE